jgi:hypothetical protein
MKESKRPVPDEENQNPSGSRTRTRRWFLRTVGTAGALGVASAVAESKFGVIIRTMQPKPEEVHSEVPPQLAGKDIPQSNEHYRSLVDVVRTGIDEYVQDGGKPFYKRPPYYLTQIMAAAVLLPRGVINGNFDFTGTPYEAGLNFYESNFVVPIELYSRADPGTSSKEAADRELTAQGYARIVEHPPFYRDNYDYRSKTIIAKSYADTYNQTKHYIDTIRGSGKVSTSELLTYYLKKNNGDINQSLMDTELFLELTVRGNRENLALPEQPQSNETLEEIKQRLRILYRGNAESISSMFYDEFSPRVPLDWLLEHIPPNDNVLNSTDSMIDTQWKDYMPANRAGIYYHVWSIAGMATIMDPELVEEAVTISELGTNIPEHGRIKLEADLAALHQVREVRDIFDSYRVDY